MKNLLLTMLAALGVVASASASAAQGACPQGFEQARATVSTIGAINQDAYRTVESLLENTNYTALAKAGSPELKALFDASLVQPIQGGTIVCADIKAGFFQYARHVKLSNPNIMVWVREKDFANID